VQKENTYFSTPISIIENHSEEKVNCRCGPTVKTAILLNMDEVKTLMNVIRISNVLLQTTLHQDQTACIRTIKESGNAVILINIVDIKKLDARIMAFKNISFN
jgi:hypothetical protein